MWLQFSRDYKSSSLINLCNFMPKLIETDSRRRRVRLGALRGAVVVHEGQGWGVIMLFESNDDFPALFVSGRWNFLIGTVCAWTVDNTISVMWNAFLNGAIVFWTPPEKWDIHFRDLSKNPAGSRKWQFEHINLISGTVGPTGFWVVQLTKLY